MFERNGQGGWLETKLTASDRAPGEYFGYWASYFSGVPVAIEGDRIAAGSRSAVYLFEPDGNGGWAETNLGLYGSSHVGIFGAIIEKTNVEGILGLDLLVTDYYGPEAYPTIMRVDPGMKFRPPLAWELALLAASLRAIPQLVDANSEKAIVRLASDAGEIEIRLSWFDPF